MKKITRKSMLYKSGVEYADFGLNHVEGCSHGCTYPCYAMMMKKRCGKIKSYSEWIEPKIVENSLELLDQEIPRYRDKIKQVFLCFTTDPFMYQIKEVEELTLKILEKLNNNNIKSILVSKGIYPTELTDFKRFGNKNEYGSTIVTSSEIFRKKFEPGASPIIKRIKALRNLHEAGLKTWISMEPYPTPNIFEQNIRDILSEISFVDKIVFGRWNYNSQSSILPTYKNFYNSMACEVLSFCNKHNIDVHIKEGTINKEKLAQNAQFEQRLLEEHLNLAA